MSVSLFIEQLEASARALPTEPEGRKVFSASKRALKALAKDDKLSEEERGKIIKILERKGFKKNVQGFSSTEMLFREPRLWKILFHPNDFPDESKALNCLTTTVFRKFIACLTQLTPPDCHIEEVIEITRAVIPLKDQRFAKFFISYLEEILERASSLKLESFYLVAALLPHKKPPVPSILKGLIPENMTGEEIAQEYALFKRMMGGTFAEEKSRISPEQLCRFFLFLDRSCHSTPLGQEVFDFLLVQLKAGELDTTFGQALVAIGLDSTALRERVKKDKCRIQLEGMGEIEVSLWPMFVTSDFVRSLVRTQMIAKQTIVLEGIKAKVFYLFHDLWIKKKDIDLLQSYSLSELIGLLDCMTYFLVSDFVEIRVKVCDAIVYKGSLAGQPELTTAELNILSAFDSYMKKK
jgi:hypothetical protein